MTTTKNPVYFFIVFLFIRSYTTQFGVATMYAYEHSIDT